MITFVCNGRMAIYMGERLNPNDPNEYVVEAPESELPGLIGGLIDARPLRTLAEARRQATLRVNLAAGQSRVKYFTNIPGQEITYVEKQNEAKAYQAVVDAGGTPVPTDYPICNAEAGTTGYTLAEVIAQVQTAAAQMTTVGAQIEATRRGAIVEAQQADTLDAIDAINPVFP